MAKNPNEAMDQAAGAAREGMNAAQDGAREATDQFQAAGERMRAAGETMTDTGSQLGLKMLDQAETNTREAFQAMRSAAQASDLTEVMRIQSDFLREQGSRSVAQAREIGEIIAEFGRNAMGQMTGRR
ncbi:phasin family protein [Sphingomonas sp. Y38-1Y]|jgi:phasin family protein|uniref:phasin family protein n=1 Tax=Sphingomonas sp. Y38-1Y TaxID=3078265 RepID=UPI0028EE4CF5|nr:phasin family protein [Sphingomonas sp. Y38-1Y]